MSEADFERGQETLERLAAWWSSEGSESRNEATTRLHLIDELLMGALGWPKAQLVAEESYGGKYADYCFGRPATRLIVEAKREGVTFELPAGIGPGPVSLKTLFQASGDIESAVRQVLGYCQERGVPFAAVSNGHQLIAFVASRDDAVPPLSAKALVFDSLDAMRSSFALLWNNLSRDGVEALRLHAALDDVDVATPPEKLSARTPGYPGFWVRNRIQTELKILGDLVLQDIVSAPELEEEFLRRCYFRSNTLSEYAIVSREILEARYSALSAAESDATVAPARRGAEISDELQTDVIAASLGRRPVILLGNVGVGKSIFIRHFVRVDARDVMERSTVLTINFGNEPALADDLNDYVLDRFGEQLAEYGVNVEASNFVRKVYKRELQQFERGIHGKLKRTNPEQYELKEIELLEKRLAARDRHLRASLMYATRTSKRQVVVFLDNIDQRDFEFQEKVFLIGQSLAETWPATVFLTLRPETFYRSRRSGSLTAYQPRVFTISPPEIGAVMQSRLAFCRELVEDTDTRRRIIPAALDPQTATLAAYLKVIQDSFRLRQDLVELVENLAGGNVRAALGYLNTFVGSGLVDTRKILDIAEESGGYTVSLHELVRSILYGDHQNYDPSASPIANLLEISRPDGREHFLLSILLAHIERAGEVGRQDGFVAVSEILAFTQGLGFLPGQAEFALRHGVDKKLLERGTSSDDADPARRYRITTVGAYTYRRLLRTFVYLDAVVVDTPIADETTAERIDDVREISARLARARIFVDYLDAQFAPLRDAEFAFDWGATKAALDSDLDRILRTISRPDRPKRPAKQRRRRTARQSPRKRSR